MRTMRTRRSLSLVAEAQLGCAKQAIDDVVVAADAVIYQLEAAAGPMTKSGGISPWLMPLGNSI